MEGEKKGKRESMPKLEGSQKLESTQGEPVTEDEGREKIKKTQVSFRKIFRDSDIKDTWLMALGTMGCVADGSSTPLIMLVLSKIMNTYAVDSSFTLKDINKVCLVLNSEAFANFGFIFLPFGVCNMI